MEHKYFTVYKSSAGSGKTFTLVKEYLSLALNDASSTPRAYKHILAITFTNKAAAEMKERIIAALRDLATEDYSTISTRTLQLLELLKSDSILNPRGELTDAIIRKRAQNVLTEILHHYTDFAIGTIDSFVSKVIHTFAFDLKLPMSFELELDEDKLLTQAIDLLLAKVGNDEKITKVLVEFTERKTDDEKSWHVENELKLFAKNLLTESGTVHIDKLKDLKVDDFFSIKNVLQTELKKFNQFIQLCGNEGLEKIKKAGLTPDKLAGGANGIHKYFSYLSAVNPDKLIPSNTVQKNIDADKWYSGKADATDKTAIDGIKEALLQLYDKAWGYIQEHIQEITVYHLINTHIYSLAVLNEIEKLLSEYKTQNNIVHISEFNKMIAKVVLHEPVPFIYERLGERYQNYLIDEFQDTSVLQFHNLLPLIENALSERHFTMLVGDGKQAIYRWRGGEVEQFSMLPKIFAHNDNPLVQEREDALIRNYNPRVLNKNFRSKREIIEFNNAFFKTLAQQLDERFRPIYENAEQEFNPENTGGYIQVEFLEGENKQLWKEDNLNRIHEVILNLQKDHYRLKDIAILVRRNTDGNEVANYLSQKGIPVISSDSLLLSNSKEVNFIAALLSYINNSDDHLVQVQLLEYLSASEKLPEKNIHRLITLSKEHGFDQLLKKVVPDFNLQVLVKLPLYELCEELIRLFHLTSPANAYLQFFLDEALNYTIKQNSNLNDFLNHWNEKKDSFSLIIPKGMNAVTIMTIHKSKGLEFPAVIFPFAGKSPDRQSKNLWINLENKRIPQLTSALVPLKSSLENTKYAALYAEEKNKSFLDLLNVLYVALTRPEERLYILAESPSKNPSALTNVSDILAHYYKTIGEWQEGKNLYMYGNEMLHKQKKESSTDKPFNALPEIKTLYSSSWRNSIKMRAAAPSIWNLEEVNAKKDYGVLVHTALAFIRYHDDVKPAIERLLADGLLAKEEEGNLKSTLNNVVHHPLLKHYFEKGAIVKNEADIITPEGEVFRPDRVVLQNNSAVIIDYKTGEEKPAHKKQLLQYADLLSQMGYIVTEKLLVYIEGEKVLKV